MPRVRSSIDLGFIIGAIALVVVGAFSVLSSRRLRNEARWVSHTYDVIHVLDQLESDVRLPVHDPFVDQRAGGELDQLRALTSDNRIEQQRLDTLSAIIGGPRGASLALVQHMKSEESRLLRAREESTDASAKDSALIIVSSTVLALLIMGVARWILHRDLRRRQLVENALLESEAKYRLLMQQAADAILIVNSDAVCVEANQRASEILGRPRDEISGLPLSAFVRRDGAAKGPVLPMLRYGHVTTGEFAVERPNGSRVAVEIRATILADGLIQVIARDISERKEIERAKDEFVSIVSHELRTPLTSIRGALGLLAANRLDLGEDKRHRMIDLAASNTDRLIRLVNDILDVERLNSGKVAFDRRRIQARDIVSQTLDGLRTVADRAGVQVQWQAADLTIWADADRLTQTLTNLVDNAVKFSPAGSTVDVSVRRDGRFALFEVRDHGRGIPADKLQLIFGRFQQIDATDSREKGGSGLGLAICKSIVEQHGGRIWVDSTPGDGSAFRFTIPLT